MTVLKNLTNVHPNTGLILGNEYKIQPSGYGNTFRIGNEFISPENLETPKERFARLIKSAGEFIVTIPTKGYTVEILQTESYLIMYSHSKGNHWNMFGNHYKYFHCVNTGELLPSHLAKNEPVIWKERLLKAEALKMKGGN